MYNKLILAFALALAAIGTQAESDPGPAMPRHATDAVPRDLAANLPRPTHCSIQNNNTGSPLAPDVNDDGLFKLLSAQPRCPENALCRGNTG